MSVEDNAIIAEYMGKLKKKTYKSVMEFALLGDDDETVSIGKNIKSNKDIEYKYHSSWDWLMPVCHKIADIRCDLENTDLLGMPYNFFGSIDLSSPIDIVYKAVVKFIKTYNKGETNGRQ